MKAKNRESSILDLPFPYTEAAESLCLPLGHCMPLEGVGMRILQLRAAKILVLCMLAICGVLGCGSSSKSMDPIDHEDENPLGLPGYSLFNPDEGLRLQASPDSIIAGVNTMLRVVIQPLHNGKGRVRLIGHGGGHSVGRVLKPVQEEMLDVMLPLVFDEGEPITQNWLISIYDNYDLIGLSAQAWYDSVEIDGHLFSITSQEVYSYFGPFISTRAGDHILLYRRMQ